MNAALTGHLVLSTLHTNDSATTFPRLLDMGVPSFLIASTVNVAIGQRLVRQLCSECKVPRKLPPGELAGLIEIIPNVTAEMTFYESKGCVACNGSGYQGRIAIRELLEIKEDIRHLIMNRASAQEIKEAAIANGMTTMIQDALQKAQRGLTSLEEIIRVVHE